MTRVASALCRHRSSITISSSSKFIVRSSRARSLASSLAAKQIEYPFHAVGFFRERSQRLFELRTAARPNLDPQFIRAEVLRQRHGYRTRQLERGNFRLHLVERTAQARKTHRSQFIDERARPRRR